MTTPVDEYAALVPPHRADLEACVKCFTPTGAWSEFAERYARELGLLHKNLRRLDPTLIYPAKPLPWFYKDPRQIRVVFLFARREYVEPDFSYLSAGNKRRLWPDQRQRESNPRLHLVPGVHVLFMPPLFMRLPGTDTIHPLYMMFSLLLQRLCRYLLAVNRVVWVTMDRESTYILGRDGDICRMPWIKEDEFTTLAGVDAVRRKFEADCAKEAAKEAAKLAGRRAVKRAAPPAYHPIPWEQALTPSAR